MYTVRVPRPRTLRARHSVENQWDLLTAIGMAPPDPDINPTEMAIDADVVTQVRGRLNRAGLRAGDRLIVIHVSAGNPFRRWPAGSFAAVASRLARIDPRNRIIITSGPSEQDAAAAVTADARRQLAPPALDRVLSCGEFNLAELRALADAAALYIGGDSGPLHVASASQIPIVGLYGPTLPARSAPWRAREWFSESVEVPDLPCRPCDQRVCEPGDFRCLTRIQPDEVIAAATRALARASGKM
jgi:ADP-heptose:LPS heptosyltransferase